MCIVARITHFMHAALRVTPPLKCARYPAHMPNLLAHYIAWCRSVCTTLYTRLLTGAVRLPHHVCPACTDETLLYTPSDLQTLSRNFPLIKLNFQNSEILNPHISRAQNNQSNESILQKCRKRCPTTTKYDCLKNRHENHHLEVVTGAML